jgi:hypothetical protein
MAVRLSALRAGRPLPPGRFLVLIVGLSRPHGHSAAGRIRPIEKSNDIEIRTRDHPACSIVPQPFRPVNMRDVVIPPCHK